MYKSLELPVSVIPGIKDKREKTLNQMGIKTVGDLLRYYPFRYEDRRNKKNLYNCEDNEKVLVCATVINKSFTKVRKNLSMVRLSICDDSGRAQVTYFNQPYMMDKINEGEEYYFFGKASKNKSRVSFTNPVTEKEPKNTDCIIPVYRLKKGITMSIIQNAVKSAVELIDFKETETIPGYIRRKRELCDLLFAFKNIHFPLDDYSLKLAKRRLVFEELLVFELGLISKKKNTMKKQGIVLTDLKIAEELAKILPYELTKAQKRVIREIAKDMHSGKMMNRLVQGDVGSGKTIVACAAVLMVVNCGFQGTIMAPTEILANQHYDEMKSYFSSFGYKTALLTGSTKKSEKTEILEELKKGEIDVLIGTHALIENNVEFKNLGICVVDEQHRFGVQQREKLINKGNNPHILVMSATPIPRTLALIMYSDLDISVIDEMPAGRKPVKTLRVYEKDRDKINSFILKELKNGNQIYIVCPLVEEGENTPEDLKDAVQYKERVEKIFSEYKVALLHGKMKNSEKDAVMLAFKNRETDILVSTTVIEVGVNVPTATVMLVENAERFGLSGLHQLRGRVGRGDKQGYNILVCDSNSDSSRERMRIMEETNDGFKISEFDLKLRGPGDFFGTAQSGFIDMKIANLMGDTRILKEALEEANNILDADCKLQKSEHKMLKIGVEKMFNISNI